MARYRRPLPEFSRLLPRGPNGLPLADLGQRLAAHLLDGLVFALFLVPLGRAMPKEPPRLLLLAAILVVLIPVVIQAGLLTMRGQSLGKIVLRTRIVDYRTGNHPGFARIVLVRSALLVLGGWGLGLFGVLDAFFIFGRERRCLHDLMAGTTVVRADAVVADPSRAFE